MRQQPSTPEQNFATSQTLLGSYQPPRVIDLGAWQAVTLAISLPVFPGNNSFNSPDVSFKKVEW